MRFAVTELWLTALVSLIGVGIAATSVCLKADSGVMLTGIAITLFACAYGLLRCMEVENASA